MMIQKYKWLLVALTAIALLAIGFFIGRANQKTIVKTETKYVNGETVRDSFSYPVPVEVIKHVPDVRYLPSKKDTIRLAGDKIFVIEKVDTAAIVNQFTTERKYKQTLFDNDTAGKLIVNTSVQFNEQKSIGYSFTPVQKVTTITKVKRNTFTPFVSASYNTLNFAGIGGGVFIKKIGFEYKYLNNLKGSTGHEGGIKIKF